MKPDGRCHPRGCKIAGMREEVRFCVCEKCVRTMHPSSGWNCIERPHSFFTISSRRHAARHVGCRDDPVGRQPPFFIARISIQGQTPQRSWYDLSGRGAWVALHIAGRRSSRFLLPLCILACVLLGPGSKIHRLLHRPLKRDHNTSVITSVSRLISTILWVSSPNGNCVHRMSWTWAQRVADAQRMGKENGIKKEAELARIN